MNKLVKLFKTNKVFQRITSVMVAFAMLLSLNYTFAFGCINMANTSRKGNVAHALYSATTKTYNFNNDAGVWNNAFVSGDSGTRANGINQNLVDFKDKNDYQPDRFFYGTSTNSVTAAGEPSTTGTDNYAAYIALTDYNVARKSIKSGEYETVKDTSTEPKEHNIIYIYPASDSNLQSAKDLVAALNAKVGMVRYKLQDKDAAHGYEDNIYSKVDAEHMSADYKELQADIEAVNNDNKAANDAAGDGATPAPIFDIGLYNYNLKSKFDYAENYMYFRTLNSIDGGLSANSYYAVSVWVYTKGDASATLRVNSDNGFIDAKISNITTDGVWQQYYLFIETRAAETCSRVYIYLYYGDENGVTGSETLDSNIAKNESDDNGENYKVYNTITGSVYFDNVQVHKINRSEYNNKTISGVSTSTRALASLGKNYSINPDDNGKEGIVYIPDYTTSGKQLSPDPVIYTARNYFAINKFNGYDFNGAPFTASDEDQSASLVNQTLTGDKLFFDSYQTNTTSPFAYYIPRYTTDTNTTPLSNAVRNQYRRLYTGDTRSLSVAVVKEADALGTYQDYVRDELGNLLDKDGKIVTDTTKAAKTEDLPINTFGDNNNVLRLINTDTDYTLGVATTNIHISQQSFYRISVWAYSDDDEAIATAKLIGNIKTGTSLTNGTQVLASVNAPTFSTPEKATDGYNGWTEIIFYVKGNNYSDKDVYLILQASSNSTIYYDNIKVEAVSSSAYTNASSTSKVDLTSYGNVTGNITDGYFNNYSIGGNDQTYTYPYAASSWSTDTKVNEGATIAGIITTNENIFSQQLIAAKNDEGTTDYLKDGEYEKVGENLKIIKDGVKLNGKELAKDTTIFKPASTYSYSDYLAGSHYYLTDNNGNYVKATTLKDMFASDAPVSYEYGEKRPAGNAYAMNFIQEDSSYYITSSSIGHSLNSTSNLSANNVYKITFQAWFTSSFKGTFVANLRSGSNNVANIEYTIDDKTPDVYNTWQTFTIYVRTGGASVGSITLQLGAKDAFGCMFLQDVDHKVLGELTDKTTGKKISASQQYDDILDSTSTIRQQNTVSATTGEMQIVKFVDYKNNNFTAYSWNNESGVYDALSYKQDNLDSNKKYKYTQGKLGIIDTDGIDEFVYNYQVPDTSEGAADDATKDESITIDSPANPSDGAASTAMLLVNTKTTDYTLANVQTGFSNSLASNSYYKISVDVKTSNLGDNGLRIIANGIAAESFNNINTFTADANTYKTYTYYVHTGTSAANNFSLSFQLGNDTGNSFTGWALVSNLQVDTITEDEYTEQTSDENRDKQTTIVKNLATTGTNSNGGKNDSDNKFNWGTFFLVLSSILLVAALAIAIIGTVVIKKSKKLKAGEAGIVSATPSLGGDNKNEGIN